MELEALYQAYAASRRGVPDATLIRELVEFGLNPNADELIKIALGMSKKDKEKIMYSIEFDLMGDSQ